MIDSFGRNINYMRISLTDLCNLRCLYCMPEAGVPKRDHAAILSLEEIEEIAAAAVELGVRKIRLTGGEPLLRKGILSLCENLSAIPGLEELAITTNGVLLPQMAKDLKAAGVKRLNISLDTMNPEKYRQITRCGELSDALKGIESAQKAGFAPLKINTVLIGGFNDDEIEDFVNRTKNEEIETRFIELMPFGEINAFGPEAYIPCSTVLQRCPQLEKIPEQNSVAELYRLPGAKGRVGLIHPLSCSFCEKCNRLRLTADGHIKPCLHSAEEIYIRGLHGGELRKALLHAAEKKPAEHGLLSAVSPSGSERTMNAIGG